MKTKLIPLFTLALAGSWLGVTEAPAQARTAAPAEKAAPSQPFPGDNMPILRSGEPSIPTPMPAPKVQGGIIDSKTGKYKLYNDSRTGLGYNFEKQEITDYRTGKVYKFSEHPADKGPKKEQKKRI